MLEQVRLMKPCWNFQTRGIFSKDGKRKYAMVCQIVHVEPSLWTSTIVVIIEMNSHVRVDAEVKLLNQSNKSDSLFRLKLREQFVLVSIELFSR